MEFKLLINQLNDLNLPRDKYVVVGSGSLAAHGIREAQDLDILVTKDFWEELSQKYPIEMLDETENINLGDVQIMFKGSMFLKPEIASLEEMIKTADIIEGHRFLTLKLLRSFKENQGREKDLKDVELIDKYLNNG